jgi:hypothetical protein
MRNPLCQELDYASKLQSDSKHDQTTNSVQPLVIGDWALIIRVFTVATKVSEQTQGK